MANAAEWRERRRLLVAEATLERVRLVHDVFRLRGSMPAVSAGSALALAFGMALAARWLRAGNRLRGLRRVWRVWRGGRRAPR